MISAVCWLPTPITRKHIAITQCSYIYIRKGWIPTALTSYKGFLAVKYQQNNLFVGSFFNSKPRAKGYVCILLVENIFNLSWDYLALSILMILQVNLQRYTNTQNNNTNYWIDRTSWLGGHDLWWECSLWQAYSDKQAFWWAFWLACRIACWWVCCWECLRYIPVCFIKLYRANKMKKDSFWQEKAYREKHF